MIALWSIPDLVEAAARAGRLDEISAPLRRYAEWAERAPSTIDQLTPQELQIAGLVAAGLTNRQVAGQLYLSPRTID